MRASKILAPLAALAAVFVAPAAHAIPEAPHAFCGVYPDAPACAGALPRCTLCHVSTSPPAWNPFGQAVKKGIAKDDRAFADALPDALHAVETEDSDGDGLSNRAEIRRGSLPGDATSYPANACVSLSMDSEIAAQAETSPPGDAPPFDDFTHLERRIFTLYCGRSPTFEETQAGQTEPTRARLHRELDTCLGSRYWRDEGLQRLADAAIRPVATINVDSPYTFRLADYYYDYRLWSFALTGERDARDLLTAQYHVELGDDGNYTRVDGIVDPKPGVGVGGEPLEPSKRAGMITTQWFLVINTMFSPLPRTTAAQAYRQYLGQDIAQQEGIWPVPNEPADVDRRGVKAPECAQCHGTLDPLSYAFAKYEGVSAQFGVFDETRPKRVIPDWKDNQSVILGTNVPDLVTWAKTAANSDEFKRKLAQTFFHHALGRDPDAEDALEFEALTQTVPTDGYSANRLIHRLVETRAFGGAQ
jgi:hypothetical protein